MSQTNSNVLTAVPTTRSVTKDSLEQKTKTTEDARPRQKVVGSAKHGTSKLLISTIKRPQKLKEHQELTITAETQIVDQQSGAIQLTLQKDGSFVILLMML